MKRTIQPGPTEMDSFQYILVGGSRGPKKANRNIVRQITKFGMIVFCKILINIWI